LTEAKQKSLEMQNEEIFYHDKDEVESTGTVDLEDLN